MAPPPRASPAVCAAARRPAADAAHPASRCARRTVSTPCRVPSRSGATPTVFFNPSATPTDAAATWRPYFHGPLTVHAIPDPHDEASVATVRQSGPRVSRRAEGVRRPHASSRLASPWSCRSSIASVSSARASRRCCRRTRSAGPSRSSWSTTDRRTDPPSRVRQHPRITSCCARRRREPTRRAIPASAAPRRRSSPSPTPTASSIATGCDRCATAMLDPTVGILIGHCRYPAGASLALRLLGAYENAKADYVVTRCAPACHFAYANNMAVRSSRVRGTRTVPGVAARRRQRAGAPAGRSQRPDLRLLYRSVDARHAPRVPARARPPAASVSLHARRTRRSNLPGARAWPSAWRAAARRASGLVFRRSRAEAQDLTQSEFVVGGIREDAILGDPRQLAEGRVREHRGQRQVDVELRHKRIITLHGDERRPAELEEVVTGSDALGAQLVLPDAERGIAATGPCGATYVVWTARSARVSRAARPRRPCRWR